MWTLAALAGLAVAAAVALAAWAGLRKARSSGDPAKGPRAPDLANGMASAFIHATKAIMDDRSSHGLQMTVEVKEGATRPDFGPDASAVMQAIADAHGLGDGTGRSWLHVTLTGVATSATLRAALLTIGCVNDAERIEGLGAFLRLKGHPADEAIARLAALRRQGLAAGPASVQGQREEGRRTP